MGRKGRDWVERGAKFREYAQWRARAYTLDDFNIRYDAHHDPLSIVAFLQHVGSPEEIQARIDASLLVLKRMHIGVDLDPEDLQKGYDFFAEWGPKAIELHGAAVEAVASLEDAGWQYDARTKRVKEIGGRGRPGELLTKEVHSLCAVWEIKNNTAETRKRIADALAEYFHPDLFLGRQVQNAVNTYLQGLVPSPRQKTLKPSQKAKKPVKSQR